MSGIRATLMDDNGRESRTRVDRFDGLIPRIIVSRGVDDFWRVYMLCGDPSSDTDGTALYKEIPRYECKWEIQE